ncbi:acyl-CoA thioesterase [Cellulomonas endophytica]|uniref:acyl-CoA thioesterase n=1 Tax=Cellulomonas endophytica TaxID=2494735 RepID=UPI00196B06E7|nr:thioesterase family protein [Cellulomonas endophytica]
MARLEVPVRLRWSDMDAYAHVNNVQMMTLLEEARIEAFWRHPPLAGAEHAPTDPEGAPAGDAAGTVGVARGDGSARPTAVLRAGPGAEVATLVARHEVEYLLPLAYQRRPVVVVLWVGHLGGASLDICYEVHDLPPGDPASAVHARAMSTLVLVDAATGAPRRISAEERAAWSPFLEEPVAFRRRR